MESLLSPQEAPYDDAADRLANQVGSYDPRHGSADLALPVPAWAEREADKDMVSPHKPLTTAQRRRISSVSTGPQYGDDAGVGYPGGTPPEHQNWPSPTPEQVERNHRYTEHWRTLGPEVTKRAVMLHAKLQDLHADIEATTERHDNLPLGDAIRGREANRLDILGQQLANTQAALDKIGGAPEADE